MVELAVIETVPASSKTVSGFPFKLLKIPRRPLAVPENVVAVLIAILSYVVVLGISMGVYLVTFAV